MINRGKILEAIYTEKLESVQVERAVRTKLADLDPHYSDTREREGIRKIAGASRRVPEDELRVE